MNRLSVFLLMILISTTLFSQSEERYEFVEGSQKITEIYDRGLLVEVETSNNNKLEYRDLYHYNDIRRLEHLERFDATGKLLYKEFYYFNSDGSLRRLKREDSSGQYHHWFYKNDKISESWFIEGDLRTRSLYVGGKVGRKEVYSGDKIISEVSYEYSRDGILLSSRETVGEKLTIKVYNTQGFLIRIRGYEEGILVKQTDYSYTDGELTLETVSGHGQKERIEYIRDDEGELTSTLYFINDNLKKQHFFPEESVENIEYYREGALYLKEYYIDGERVKKELYLNGELFSSEALNE